MKKIIGITILLLIGLVSFAQELSCKVTVNGDQLTNTNKQVFISMQKDIEEFMNNHRWTDMQYQANEKIDCSLTITLSTQSDEKTFAGDLYIQARRPVYNSTYYTPIFNFKDGNFAFEYIEHTPLEYVDGTFTNNLTAVLAYYAYIIIGYDSDSYSKLGGSSSFKKAETIVNQAQSQSEVGWKAFEDDKNRYALINHLMDESFRKFREYFYEYHRLGLDEMSNSTPKGSAKIADGIETLREVNRARPSSIVLVSFIDMKRDEIINIFSKAPAAEKTKVYEILMDVDPAKQDKYKTILNN